MVETSRERSRERTLSALAVAAIHAALGYALVTGLGFELPPALSDELKLFDVPQPPPPPPPEPPPPAAAADPPAGAPAPPNLKAEPTPIVAPPIRLERPSPVVAAPVAGQGSAPSAGAAEVKGPGTGAGGAGTGTGGGGQGRGTGGAAPTAARKLSGALVPFRLPRSVLREDLGADITFRIAVGPDGRVAACTVERMTGAAEIGPHACRAIQERYRYEPARDSEGKAVASVLFENHAWGVDRPRRRR